MKKIIVLAITCIVSVCCLFFVKANYNAVAETEQVELEITNYNLAFQDTIYIMYAVENNVQDYKNIKVLVWKTPQEEYVKGTENSELNFNQNQNVGGKYKAVFLYKDLTLKEMTQYVYARPYYVKDGQEYYGKTVKYSILDYALDRLENSSDTAFKDMVSAMLTLGTTVQTYKQYKMERLPTDTYYKVKVENGTLIDGYSSGLYNEKEEIKLKSSSDENVTVKWYSTKNELVKQQEVPADMLTNDFALSYDTEIEIESEEISEEQIDSEEQSDSEQESEEISEPTESSCFSFTLLENDTYEIEVIDTYNLPKNVVIPSTYNEKPVTSIGDDAFCDCSGLTSITIPNSVKTIGGGAFCDCSGLTSVKI